MQSLKAEHVEAARCVIRYLKGSVGEGIVLSAKNNLQLYGFFDSDLGACRLSQRSLTGYYVSLGGSPIS